PVLRTLIRVEMWRQKLEGNGPMQGRVLREVNASHPAATQLTLDPVWAHITSLLERSLHRSDYIRDTVDRKLSQKFSRLLVRGHKPLDQLALRCVAAGRLQKRLSLLK